MAYLITVRLDITQAEIHSLQARILGFAEDVHRLLRDNEWGNIDLNAIDKAGFVGKVDVTAVAKKNVRRAIKMLSALLAENNIVASVKSHHSWPP